MGHIPLLLLEALIFLIFSYGKLCDFLKIKFVIQLGEEIVKFVMFLETDNKIK